MEICQVSDTAAFLDFKEDRVIILQAINDYLLSFPDDRSRLDALNDIIENIDVCEYCGGTLFPYYCHSSFDI
jgi:hypothetical protein